jgi:hypothetical protein
MGYIIFFFRTSACRAARGFAFTGRGERTVQVTKARAATRRWVLLPKKKKVEQMEGRRGGRRGGDYHRIVLRGAACHLGSQLRGGAGRGVICMFSSVRLHLTRKKSRDRQTDRDEQSMSSEMNNHVKRDEQSMSSEMNNPCQAR